MSTDRSGGRRRAARLGALVTVLLSVVASVATTLYVVERRSAPVAADGGALSSDVGTEQVLDRSGAEAEGDSGGGVRSADATRADGGAVLHVTPDGAGARDGSSWEQAGTLADVAAFIDGADPGDEVWIRGDQGRYDAAETIEVASGGDADAAVTVRGVAADGSESATPLLVGGRADPYRVDGEPGSELFKLLPGADHLRFRNLDFANQGNGVFRIGGDIQDLTLAAMRADNVRRFLEDYPSGSAKTATVSGLLVEDVEVHGYSKGAIRLRDDSHDVVIRDVVGDSQRQDGDEFAMGVSLSGSVHDVLLERVVMRKSLDTGSESDYWNGDGFATERGTSDVTFRDTRATDNSDAGYDLKSTDTVLVRAVASGNKRNFRFWGTATATGCIARNPVKRGGTGSRANVWAAAGARVELRGCSFAAEARSGEALVSLEDGARVTVVADEDGAAGGG